MTNVHLRSRIIVSLFLPIVIIASFLLLIGHFSYQGSHGVLLGVALVTVVMVAVSSAWWLIHLIEGEQLRKEQQLNFLQTLIDTIPNPIYYKDAAGHYLGCNKAFESSTGARRTEIMCKSAEEFFVRELADIYTRGDGELFARGGEQIFGSIAPYADGTLRHVIFHKATFDALDSAIGGLVGIYVDISEQKEAQDALAREKNFSVSLLQGSATPTFVLDHEHRVLIWNRACEALTGVLAADVVGTDRHWQAFHTDRRPCLADIVLSGGQADMPEQVQFGLSPTLPEGIQGEGWHDLQGERKYLLFNAAPIYDDTDAVVAVVETLEDITDRKLLEEKLRQLTFAVTQSPAGILITNCRGKVEYINPRFTEMTGYVLEDLQGANASLFRWGDASPAVYRDLLATLREGNEWRGRFHSRRKSGELYWEQAQIGPIKDDAGNITHYIAMKEDISERVRLEEQLQYSQKMDSIGRMAGGLAHDINNILTAIVGYVSIMELHTVDDSPLCASLTKIKEAVDRAASLTQGLLDFGRKQQHNPQPVNLNEVVNRVATLITSLLGEDVSLHNFLSDKPLEVLADSIQVEQVIMHLVNNARDAMPQGGELWIGTRRVVLDQQFVRSYGFGVIGEYALLTVTDNGSGMDLETLEKIYEPFFTTKRVGSGTGLGLSVVYGIVKRHRGFVTCYSEPGKGTQFNIYLPIYSGPVEDTDKREQLPAMVHSERAGFRGDECILVVEDDPDVSAIIKGLLEEFGYLVLTAGDGKEAVRIFEGSSNVIKLVILDAIMPHKGGWDTFGEMKQLAPELRAIFVSGYNREALMEKGLLDETADYLPKPIAPVEMLRLVREVLDR